MGTPPFPAVWPDFAARHGLIPPPTDAAPGDDLQADEKTVRPALDRDEPPAVDLRQRIEGELLFLRRAVRRWCREKAEAEDLIQDTVMLALANAAQWQPGSDLRAWLFTIMRNRFLAGTARSKRSNAAIDAIVTDECAPVTSRPEARLVMRDLERALLRLPSRQEEAIRLIGIEGRSYEQAARLMGMSVAAVRCHLARGRERLRSIVYGTADPAPPRRLAPWVTEPAPMVQLPMRQRVDAERTQIPEPV